MSQSRVDLRRRFELGAMGLIMTVEPPVNLNGYVINPNLLVGDRMTADVRGRH